MPDNKKEIINLLNFITEPAENDIGKMKEELAKEGVDPTKLLKEGNAIVKKLLGAQRREFAKNKLLHVKDKLRDTVIENIKLQDISAKEYLLSLLSDESSSELQASFRKIENITDDEALEMLNENQYLEIYSQLMNDDK